jgi:acyl dehydratase
MTSMAADPLGRLGSALTTAPFSEIVAGVGAPPAYSRWLAIDQATIDRFAELTNDHNWLHVDPERAAASPAGGTIAHGFLTLSLIATMAYEVLPRVQEAKMGMNYGLNKVRFVAPVPVGSRVRGAFALVQAKSREDGSRTELTYAITLEIEGRDKPALVAEWIRVAIF